MADIDTSAEAVAKVLSLATQGKPVQFNPQFCEEAKGTKAQDWDTSHDLSVIRADGSRYKIGHFRHADDALFDQLARELVPALSRDLEQARQDIADLRQAVRYANDHADQAKSERDAAIARAEQAETQVVELEAALVAAHEMRKAADRVSEWFCTEASHLEGPRIQALRACMLAYDRQMWLFTSATLSQENGE